MQFFLKRLLFFVLFGSPIILLIIGYLYFDPFRIIYQYADYSRRGITPNINWDYLNTETFIKRNKKYHYNAFIFGSSRTVAFRVSSWRKYLKNNASPLTFGSSGESVYGIYTKLKYLDSIHNPIDNVLIIICRDYSFAHESNQGVNLFIKHPVTSGEGYYEFHKVFFKTYFQPAFLLAYYYYKTTHEYHSWMANYLQNETLKYDTVTNQFTWLTKDIPLKTDSAKYYAERKDIFYARKTESIDSVNRINVRYFSMLKSIKQILQKNHTQYKVVVSPLYEQCRLAGNDQKILRGLFGSNLFDLAGKNKFSDPAGNFYETSHYRPHVGDQIMALIYDKKF